MIAFIIAASLALGSAPTPAPAASASPVPAATASPGPTASPSAPHGINVTADAKHDGSDMDHAIVITAPNMKSGIAAELGFLAKLTCGTAGRWYVQKQSTIETVSKYFDQIDLDCTDSSATKTYFFDVTDFFGKP